MKTLFTQASVFFLYQVLAVGSIVAASNSVEDGILNLPIPWVIAHRGGSLLWPEETMEAYGASTAANNPFVEVDCQMLSSGAVVLMHDSTLDRTTDRHGKVSDVKPHDWGDIMVNGRKLLGEGWGYYHAPYFDEVLASFRNQKIIVAEAKDYPSRLAIVNKLKEFRVSKNWALVNSTAVDRLRPAIAAGYKAFLVLLDMNQAPKTLKSQGLWGVSCPPHVTETYIKELKAVGLKVIGGTISRQWERDQLLRWGVDGFFTDDPLYLGVNEDYRKNTDPFSTQKWAAGMLEGQNGGRGHFSPPNKWGLDASSGNYFRSCLQGWMSPIGGKQIAPEWSMEISITFGAHFEVGRWASVTVLTSDMALNDDVAPEASLFGYHILFHNTGGLSVYRFDGAIGQSPALLKSSNGPMIHAGDTIRYRITTTAEQIKIERLDGKSNLVVEDKSYRGAYVTFGAKGEKADFSNVKISFPLQP